MLLEIVVLMVYDLISRFIRDSNGATAIEYALIASIVSVGILLALNHLSDELKILFDGVAGKVTNSD